MAKNILGRLLSSSLSNIPIKSSDSVTTRSPSYILLSRVTMSSSSQKQPQSDQIPNKKNGDKNEPKNKQNPKDTEEFGGPKGPEPTRYGDWERNGRCSDF
ncbi:uncharacterized protein LOC126671956 [Mercurialis annua]|uniref:uncharacterized protein LOC126671956 n=1 Tax=Mercurialis annua TaxID=3986 RepID=UPI00215EF3B0|nr:uncharacterized protein LOC126671956 [Mercurialis annua]